MGERMSETEHEAPVEVDEPVPYVDEDPFAAWPQPESGEVIEDPPEEGESVEHVEGEIEVPDGYEVIEGNPSGRKRQVAVVVSRFNGGLTNRMLARALEALEEAGGPRTPSPSCRFRVRSSCRSRRWRSRRPAATPASSPSARSCGAR